MVTIVRFVCLLTRYTLYFQHNNPYVMAMVNDGTKLYDHQRYNNINRFNFVNHIDDVMVSVLSSSEVQYSRILFNTSSKFLSYLDCYLLSPKNAK